MSARNTSQGAAVEQVLNNAKGFRSAQDLHAELRKQGISIGLTTVYRHLTALSERGSIDVIRNDSGEALFRRCESQGHHHHVTCRSCGASVEVESVEVEAWAERVAGAAGYVNVAHSLEVFGLCPNCAKANARNQ